MAQAMDEVFFITGAGTGIGRVTARYLLLKGLKVFLTDSNLDFLKETCTEHFPSVLPLDKQHNYKWAKMDVTEDDDVKTAVAACIDAFGRMDVLMNNAGINSQYTRQGIRMDAAPTSDFVQVLSTNLIGTYRVSQHSIRHLEKSPNGGVIINISSCRATQTSPHGEAYAASKAGINGLTMSMAISLGPKIRVHSLSPGFVDVRFERSERLLPEREKLVGDLHADYLTEYVPEWGFGESPGMGPAHPVGRFGRGEDVARWVEFLGVGEGGFTTGGEFMVDGGYSKVLSYPK